MKVNFEVNVEIPSTFAAANLLEKEVKKFDSLSIKLPRDYKHIVESFSNGLSVANWGKMFTFGFEQKVDAESFSTKFKANVNEATATTNK